MLRLGLIFLLLLFLALLPLDAAGAADLKSFAVPEGSHPHDVAPAPDGTVWYTAQYTGALGRLDPRTGTTRQIPLGRNSAPHGVIVGPDGAPWITDAGQNAILRVDPQNLTVTVYDLPPEGNGAGLNTATFDVGGVLWFTGYNGFYGRLDPARGKVEVFEAPGGSGPYGIAAAPDGSVWYASLAGSHIARIDTRTAKAEVFDPPTRDQGARRLWVDSKGIVWVAEWNAGQLARFDPAAKAWREWHLPGKRPSAYAVYVDERDKVWLTDFGGNAIWRFDPATEQFSQHALPEPDTAVRQLLGRRGEIWGAGSGIDQLLVIDNE